PALSRAEGAPGSPMPPPLPRTLPLLQFCGLFPRMAPDHTSAKARRVHDRYWYGSCPHVARAIFCADRRSVMDDLGLDLFRTRGRATVPVSTEIVGAVTLADLGLLEEENGSKPGALSRIVERHHAMGRMLAGGMKPGEVAVEVGMLRSRMSILQDDPTFQEVVAFYRDNEEEVYED